MTAFLNDFDPDQLVLPLDEIRLLALIISTRDGAEPFVRKMMKLSESVKAGRGSDAVARLARQNKDHTLTQLLAPMSQAVGEGRIVAVRNTAFFAASFAYQNSLDYMRELINYLDRFKRRPRIAVNAAGSFGVVYLQADRIAARGLDGVNHFYHRDNRLCPDGIVHQYCDALDSRRAAHLVLMVNKSNTSSRVNQTLHHLSARLRVVKKLL